MCGCSERVSYCYFYWQTLFLLFQPFVSLHLFFLGQPRSPQDPCVLELSPSLLWRSPLWGGSHAVALPGFRGGSFKGIWARPRLIRVLAEWYLCFSSPPLTQSSLPADIVPSIFVIFSTLGGKRSSIVWSPLCQEPPGTFLVSLP